MTPLQRYIAEEIATDHVDGLLFRREALRRLALLGVGTAAATALIAACGESRGPTASTTSKTSAAASIEPGPPPGMENAVQPAPITWADGKMQGSWAAAAQPRGAVLVVHENKGLNDWVRSVVGRFGGSGYSALGIDLLSAQGGTAAFKDPAEATAALGKIPPDQFIADLRSGLDELQRRAPGMKLAMIGFCFGGGLTWQLLAAGEPRLAAALPFYGPLPDPHDFAGSKQAAVLAFYGAKDERVTAGKDAAAAALEQAGMVHQIVVEPDADHAFFNDSGPRYNAAAAADAWKQTQSWMERYLS
ncbi:dienelactone hydrolase family protein [Mycolicibacterium llatzerense]|uniref:dienelactone hydrolase family protein n=1 Tax=Mycolicibacterium llatzerense TaxID=280871 RepID=UPI0021B5A131|nr:dienelactone hydrolase family protein [Mycolicibacterium llatzerense]MCT7364248.1 dienelactone hydrolase [Mycolicibacterium llatzerense]